MTAIIFGMRPIIADNHGSVRLAVLSFSHDPDGLMTSAANSSGAVSNEYDDATGWLTASRGADGTEVSYSRRSGGSVASITSAAGTTSYAFDTAGRKTHVASPSGSFAIGYCGWNGKISASTNSHGFVVQYAYDIMDRVTNIAWRTASGASVGGFAYEYDAIGRITARSLGVGTNSFDRVYAYDDLDRLASDGDVTYTYDAAGNRMTRTEDGATVTYTLGVGDRLASWTGGAYTHDAAGNVTRIEREGRPTLFLTWNSRYQLDTVYTNGVFAEGYEYDALGRRVATANMEGTTRHIYDDNWQVVADLDEDDNVVASYIWGDGIDHLLAVNVGGASYYPLTDTQGSVWGYVDSQNNVVARWQYDAWGNVVDEYVSVSALARLRYRFQCREWSAATGLIHFRMRWYDPETGRWLSKDPIGLSGGLNLYESCGSNLILETDPIGLAVIKTRPLDAGDKWGPDFISWSVSRINIPGNLDIRHKEIFFEDGKDTEDCPSHIGYGPNGVVKDPSNHAYNNKVWWERYDDALMRDAVDMLKTDPLWSRDKYKLFSHNCQDFVSAAIEKYKELKKLRNIK